MNKNFKILGAVMLGFMSFSCNNNQGNNSSEATTPVWVEDVQLRNIEEYITTTGTAKAAKTIEIKSETELTTYRKIRKPVVLISWVTSSKPELSSSVWKIRNMKTTCSWKVRNYKSRSPRRNGKVRKSCSRKAEQPKKT